MVSFLLCYPIRNCCCKGTCLIKIHPNGRIIKLYATKAIEIGRVYRKQVLTKEELLNKSMDAIAEVLHVSAEEQDREEPQTKKQK